MGGGDVTSAGVHAGPGPPHHRLRHAHLCARLCCASGYVGLITSQFVPLSFIGGVHIGARALHVLNLIWFGCVARLSQCGGGG